MGNNIGGRNKAKVILINGETFKFKTPIEAWDIVKCYPGHVLLESETVKLLGLKASPLGPQEELEPNKIYFLVQMPTFSTRKTMRRSQSNITTSNEDRLEQLMLMRRSVSDLSVNTNGLPVDGPRGPGPSTRPIRMKVKLPMAQLARLMGESRDGGEVARKIIELYGVKSIGVGDAADEVIGGLLWQQQVVSW